MENFVQKLSKKNQEYSKELLELKYIEASNYLNELADSKVTSEHYFNEVYHDIIKEKLGKDVSFAEYCKDVDLVLIMKSFTFVLFAAQFLDAVDSNPGFTEKQYIAAYKATKSPKKKVAHK